MGSFKSVIVNSCVTMSWNKSSSECGNDVSNVQSKEPRSTRAGTGVVTLREQFDLLRRLALKIGLAIPANFDDFYVVLVKMFAIFFCGKTKIRASVRRMFVNIFGQSHLM